MIEEVLSDLKRLSLKGLIKSIGSGSNSIGKTLQSELGFNTQQLQEIVTRDLPLLPLQQK